MAAITSNDEQSPDIYKLPVELLLETFDYLPFEDLCAIRQTSNWFSEVAELCYKKNYSALQPCTRRHNGIEYKAFYGLIQKVGIYSCEIKHIQEYYPNRGSEFQQVKQFRFSLLNFASITIEYINEIVGKIE